MRRGSYTYVYLLSSVAHLFHFCLYLCTFLLPVITALPLRPFVSQDPRRKENAISSGRPAKKGCLDYAFDDCLARSYQTPWPPLLLVHIFEVSPLVTASFVLVKVKPSMPSTFLSLCSGVFPGFSSDGELKQTNAFSIVFGICFV